MAPKRVLGDQNKPKGGGRQKVRSPKKSEKKPWMLSSKKGYMKMSWLISVKGKLKGDNESEVVKLDLIY